MKQKPIASQTTPILFQHPTTAELRPSRGQIIWANLRDFTLFTALAFLFWVVITLILMTAFGG